MANDLPIQALSALRQKNYPAAREFIASYANDNPLEFQHYLIKGLAELAMDDWAAAEETFADAVHDFPHQPQLWSNLGIAQENLGKLLDATDSFEHSLDLKPEQGDVCGNLSNIYRRTGRFTEAEEMAHRAYEHGAPRAQALNSLGLALGMQGKNEAAEKIFQKALRLESNNPLVLANLANLAVDRLNFNEAWPRFATARATGNNPTVRRDEGMARLLASDYAQGWPLYEARLELPKALRLRVLCPRYNGEPLFGKKLLLIAEQGFGDTIMFARYGKALAESGAELIWAVQPSLQRLLADNLPGRVFAETDALPLTDYYLPMMSLPLATRKLTPAEAPTPPYLRGPNEPQLPKAKDGKRKIGLVWTGSPTHERDHERSLTLKQLAPLWWKPEIAKSSLFYAPFTGAGLEQITEQSPVKPLESLIKDFADTAALLAQMDMLITVDTAAAHLAGAMGMKTYLLLPYCPDWRWGAEGITTGWYPSMTLLRQPTYGDWDYVIARLIELVTV